MIKEISTFIAGRAGLTLGTTLVHGIFLPENPDRCVVVAFTGGGVVDFDLPDRADIIVQCLARAGKNVLTQRESGYDDAYDDARTIYEAIHGQAGWNFTVLESGRSYKVHTITAMTYPQYLGPDENGRHYWTCNYIFRVSNAGY
jgi:Bacteriophage minor capsid protein